MSQTSTVGQTKGRRMGRRSRGSAPGKKPLISRMLLAGKGYLAAKGYLSSKDQASVSGGADGADQSVPPGLQPAPAATRRQLLTVAGLAVVVAVFLIGLAERHGYFDLRVYYGAINYWIHDGGSLYDFLLPKSTYGFTYPPFAALMMLPMAVVGWYPAIVISCVANVVAAVIVIFWFVDPVARRLGWTRWYVLALAVCFAAAFEPLRETFLFGQVNMLLLALVAADLLLLVGPANRWGGVGIGLATAIKLTPGIFIIYLLVTRRWRAAGVASLTAVAATALAGAVAPEASRIFWTDAVWNTDRVGSLAFVSNQSLNGAVNRLDPAHPSSLLWVVSALIILAIWVVRARRAVAAGDEMTGFALTGITGCLVSPVTWIHHLVWVGPALLLLFDNATAATGRRRIALFGLLGFAYALLCSRFVWNFHDEFGDQIGWFFSNAYVWISIVLLVALPVRRPMPVPVTPPVTPAGRGSGSQAQPVSEVAGSLRSP